MKALVFGGSGQLGRALQAKAGDGWTIEALGRAECDITDEGATRAMIAASDCDIIINAAAYTAVDKAEGERALARKINGDAPGWIAQQCAASNKALVHISTDFIFGEGHDEPIKPNAKASPLSVYGATKLAGELAVQAALRDVLIIRTSRVYAAEGSNFVLTMLRLMAERDELDVVADQTGSPTAAGDLADAVIRFADAGATGIYHFTNDGMCNWHEFAIAIAEESLAVGLLGKCPIITAVPTSCYPTPARRPSYSVLDKQAAWNVLGSPDRHWRDALRDTILEIKENG
ncbi:dTDP-4-dehydrorhamnose reductase [Sphingopyxis sp. BSNA05]|uniref:dTDP-4-dehydrorhamnose reductase n=1 Tax=Sphingopyxis sp. BSNA05 TaxID=1236614 RepID=UPI00156318D9|nr:dTDP-4-dehydrorhamnose reductase [Sphingopyxis sp. BSNA05]NRD89674.1 dTDP-4-dehydrorhamnose reductase [Sphingopyxis sp. BSNA05]